MNEIADGLYASGLGVVSDSDFVSVHVTRSVRIHNQSVGKVRDT